MSDAATWPTNDSPYGSGYQLCFNRHSRLLLPASPRLCQLPPSCSSTALLKSVRLGIYIEVSDAPVDLPPVTVGSGRRCSGWQAPIGDRARVPVGPVDTAGLDVNIHGVYADALIALEGLLVGRVGVPGEQAADLIVISNVEDLVLGACQRQRLPVRWAWKVEARAQGLSSTHMAKYWGKMTSSRDPGPLQ